MADRTVITPELLRQLVSYDPLTGLFLWKPRGDKSFDNRFAGKPAFSQTHKGYKRAKVLGVRILAHRAAWLMHYGEWPRDQIDHINRNRSDNRIANLRDVNQSINMRNGGLRKSNTSGQTGVYWHNAANKWVAAIRYDGAGHYLGAFISKSEASASWRSAKKLHGYSEIHGDPPSQPTGIDTQEAANG